MSAFARVLRPAPTARSRLRPAALPSPHAPAKPKFLPVPGPPDDARQAPPFHARRIARLSRRNLPGGLEARRPQDRRPRADERDAAPDPSSQALAARRHDLRPDDVRTL